MKSGKLVLGLLAGVAAGAVLGILFAPSKGSKTRRKILGKGEEYSEELKEKFNEMTNAVTEKYEALKTSAENILTKGKDEFNGLKAEIKKEMV